MNVKWYYRQSEVPDSVYQHLVQDRHNENGEWALQSQPCSASALNPSFNKARRILHGSMEPGHGENNVLEKG